MTPETQPHPPVKSLPIGVLIAAVVAAGFTNDIGTTLSENWPDVFSARWSPLICSLLGAILGALLWNKITELRGHPSMQLGALLAQLLTLIAAFFIYTEVTKWGGDKIGGLFGGLFASLILLAATFAVIFACAAWSRYRKRLTE